MSATEKDADVGTDDEASPQIYFREPPPEGMTLEQQCEAAELIAKFRGYEPTDNNE